MTDRSMFVRVLWFVLVGWWLVPALVELAWLLTLTIVLLPIGVGLLNYAPMVLTLNESADLLPVAEDAPQQRPLVFRVVYLLLVGWWLSAVWASVASILPITIIGIPLSYWMLARLPAVATLYRPGQHRQSSPQSSY